MTKTYEGFHGRTELLVGKDGLARLAAAKAFVFGLGGVGSYAAEALARAGVGHLVLVDFDTVEPSNINRQLVALRSTVGRRKVIVAAERIQDIDPDIRVETVEAFAEAENLETILGDSPAFVVDAIDSIHAKAALIAAVHRRGWPIVSCMGAANKLCPTGILVADLASTRYCPLARVLRQRLRKLDIHTGVRCVYAHENLQAQHDHGPGDSPRKDRVQGSISYVPGLFGLTAAGVIINDILDRPTPLES